MISSKIITLSLNNTVVIIGKHAIINYTIANYQPLFLFEKTLPVKVYYNNLISRDIS